MKILTVNTYDIYGGAARAAYRLHSSLKNFGVESTMVVLEKLSGDPSVIEFQREDDQFFFYDRLPLLSYPKKSTTLFSVGMIPNVKFVEYINSSDADIVHLHWIANGFLSIEDLSFIRKPIVWSLHDMWAFTGGCHYDEECGRYQSECGECKILSSRVTDDLSSKLQKEKQKHFQKINNLTIVGLSTWIAECAHKSVVLCEKKIFKLPNILDTDLYQPSCRRESRRYFQLSQTKKLILFGAVDATKDLRKGFKELLEALKKLKMDNVECVVFGNQSDFSNRIFPIKAHFIGTITEEHELIKLYSACDVMIVPSKQEVFGQTAIEAMSCEIPVVAFNSTGLNDIVDHMHNGYLAKSFDTDDLAYGIEWILNHPDIDFLKQNARTKIVSTFSYTVGTPQYVKLYESIIENKTENEFFKSRPYNSLKLITEDIENWFLKLASENYDYIIYGHGNFGMAMLDYFPDKITAFVDRRSDCLSSVTERGGVYSPKNLPNMEYDKIVISVIGREEDIERYLVCEIGVPKEKIVKFLQ